MKPTIITETAISGHEALRRRDLLEAFLADRFPAPVRDWVSHALTSISGLAPTARAGNPVPMPGGRKAAELRAAIHLLLTLLLATAAILLGDLPVKLIGGFALVSAMRAFSSALGHQLTHSTKGIPLPDRWTRRAYDALAAILLLPSYLAYRDAHRIHHGKAAGPGDPDQAFIEYLGARLNTPLGLIATLLDPVLHARFLAARLRAAFGEGEPWRRILAATALAATFAMPAQARAVWLAFLLIGYQMASLVSFASLHIWGGRPVSRNLFEISTTVTWGRLLIPPPTVAGLLRLPVYALVRALWLQGDLNNHDLHHLGKGPWTEAPYVRAGLLLEGTPLRQSTGIRSMFAYAFTAARQTKPAPPKPHASQFLEM